MIFKVLQVMIPDCFWLDVVFTVAGTNKYMKQIKDVNVDSYFDLCCKVKTLFFSVTFFQFGD